VRLNEIYAKYKDSVAFFVIYTREAHPDDGWRVPDNLEANIHYKEPRSDAERAEVAAVCQVKLDLKMPMLIDTIANDAEEKYVSLPMRLYPWTVGRSRWRVAFRAKLERKQWRAFGTSSWQ
jgi:hypothetical protein